MSSEHQLFVKMPERSHMDWAGSISISISRRCRGGCVLSKSVRTLTLAALFVVAFSVFLLAGRQRFLGRSYGCNFPAIFNFGDSNSDTGGKSAAFHRIPSPNGASFFHRSSGRYCDWKLVIDFIGGSTIQPLDARVFNQGFSFISLDIQLLQFEQFKQRTNELYNEGVNSNIRSRLPRPEDFTKALYTFDIGQNDLAAAFKLMTEKQVMASMPELIDQFAQAVMRLHQLGARAFWIHNTGPIGCLPYQIQTYAPKPENVDENGCIKSQNKAAQKFNKQLKKKTSQLRMQLRDAVLTYVDTYSAKYSIISEATMKQNGFTDPLGYCCGHQGKCWRKKVVNGTEVSGDSCSDHSAYISWDGVHYSQAANKWVANKILDGSFSEPPTLITESCRN